MGNSLGDLVANLTIARMGFPSMACVASYGGILTSQAVGDVRRTAPEHPARRRRVRLVLRLPQRQVVQDSLLAYTRHYQRRAARHPRCAVVRLTSLIVAVTTLICVPASGYYMSRKFGAALIAAYCALLVVNVRWRVDQLAR